VGLLKPRTPRLYRGHPLARGLVGAFPLTERAGTTVRDAARRATGTFSSLSATAWLNSPYGASVDFSGSGYIDLGDLPQYQFGAGSFAVSMWFRTPSGTTLKTLLSRTAGANGHGYSVDLHCGSSSAGLRLQAFNNAEVSQESEYISRDLPNGSTLNDGAWHHVVIQRNATAGSTPYMEAWLDGAWAPMTNTGGDTGSHPVDSSTSISASLTIGKAAYSAFGNWLGQIAGVYLWNRRLTAREAALLYRDPWLLVRPPTHQRRDFLAGLSPYIPPPPPPPASASGFVPASGAVSVDPSGHIEVIWTPYDYPGNPFVSSDPFTLALDGDDIDFDTPVYLGGGAYKLVSDDNTFKHGQSHTVTSTAETEDTIVTSASWSFTVRGVYFPGPAPTDYYARGSIGGVAPTDYLIRTRVPGQVVTEYVVAGLGPLLYGTAPTDYTALPARGGVLEWYPAITDYLAVVTELWMLLNVGGEIGTPEDVYLSAGAEIEGRDYTVAASVGAEITSRGIDPGVSVGAEIGIFERNGLVNVGGEIGTPGDVTVSVGADVIGVDPLLSIRVLIRSLEWLQMQEGAL